MFLQLSLFSLLAFVAAKSTATVVNNPGPSFLIVAHAHGDEIRHQVSLRYSGHSYCGGSIISDKWVVTAAQCVSYPRDLITVQAGSVKESGGSLHKVAQIIVHENYTTNSDGVSINDVAVLEVSPPFDLDWTRHPISIFMQDELVAPETIATITGWGALDHKGTMPDHLQIVHLPIISKNSCDEAYKDIAHIPEDKICAGLPEGGKGTCQGDEGSPVTIGSRLAGIVSWTYGCGRKGYPDVYTDVAVFSNWIVSKTGINVQRASLPDVLTDIVNENQYEEDFI